MKTPTQLLGLAAVLMLGGIQLAAADPAADVAALHAGAPPVHGQAAIRAFFKNMMPEATRDGLEFTLGSKPAGGARGDMGWASGTYTLKDKTGHVIETGKYLSVSRKKDGKWLYIRDTWNSDGPPPSKESAAPAGT